MISHFPELAQLQIFLMMRRNFQSKSTKISSRLLKKSLQNTDKRLKLPNEKLHLNTNQVQQQNSFFPMNKVQNEADQYIFNDQKLKFQQLTILQTCHIRSRISVHQRNKTSKLHFFENWNKTTTPQFTSLNILSQHQEQISQQNQKMLLIKPLPYSQPLRKLQSSSKNEEKRSNVFKNLSQRYGLKRRGRVYTSLQNHTNFNTFLQTNAFSIQLKKTGQYEDYLRQPVRQRMYETTTLSRKSQKGQVKTQGNKLLQQQHSFTSPTHNRPQQIQNKKNAQMNKFILNGWDFQSPSFHDFEYLCIQKAKESERPQSKQANLFTNKTAITAVKWF